MPRTSRHVIASSSVSTALVQAVALLAVGAIGSTALSATTDGGRQGVRPATVRLAQPAVDQLRDSRPMIMPRVPTPVATAKPPVASVVHAVAPPAHKARKRAHVARRWLPTGTGMWIYQWNKTNHGRPASIVKQARKVGLTTLYVRTGSTHDGFTGGPVLKALLPATAHTNVRVVAWDFPELKNPTRDAKRLVRAAKVTARHGLRVAAVAPDIETPSEGTHTSAARVAKYLKTLRRLLPKNVAILATVPWPSSVRRGHYPYATVARYSDALLPMAYWYNNKPQVVTANSIAYLRRFHKPVQPVGQGYDGKLDVPSLPHNNLRKQMPAFLRTARQLRVSAVSVWSWQSAPRVTWSALASAKRWFRR